MRTALILLYLLMFSPCAQAADPSEAARMIGAALAGESAYGIVRGLADGVGPRLSGSPGGQLAIQWALAEMRRAGLDNVHAERVKVPHWVRGPAALTGGQVLAPVSQRLDLVALGGSVGTPKEGLSGEVVEVQSFADLQALPKAAVVGRIVLWNVVMKRTGRDMNNYGEVARYRSTGAIEGARLGARAVLVRSLGVADYRLPHTGAMRYDDQVAKIPAAAVSAEDAELIHRLLQQGPVRVNLQLPCQTLPDADAANVVGEVPGQDKKAEIILLGAHLDSWDLGTGAVDDGAGVAIVLAAARAFRLAGITPRRTVRVVLFANEENGLRGAKGYATAHKDELSRHVAALEADSGAGRPSGFSTQLPLGQALLSRLLLPLLGLGTATVTVGDAGGADLSPLDGVVPFFHLVQDTYRYFEWHHTAADTLDKIDPVDLDLCAAAVAAATQALADSPETLPRPPVPATH